MNVNSQHSPDTDDDEKTALEGDASCCQVETEPKEAGAGPDLGCDVLLPAKLTWRACTGQKLLECPV